MLLLLLLLLLLQLAQQLLRSLHWLDIRLRYRSLAGGVFSRVIDGLFGNIHALGSLFIHLNLVIAPSRSLCRRGFRNVPGL